MKESFCIVCARKGRPGKHSYVEGEKSPHLLDFAEFSEKLPAEKFPAEIFFAENYFAEKNYPKNRLIGDQDPLQKKKEGEREKKQKRL